MKKNTNEADESILHVAVFDSFAGRDAVGDVEVYELGG